MDNTKRVIVNETLPFNPMCPNCGNLVTIKGIPYVGGLGFFTKCEKCGNEWATSALSNDDDKLKWLHQFDRTTPGVSEETRVFEPKVIIQKHTTVNPISLIGEEAGVCWGADVTDEAKNHKRGLDCIESNHGRAMEFPQIYMVLDGWSAKVIREFYTHIGGAPTRLQASTRYIDYSKDFNVVVPPSIANNVKAKEAWSDFMKTVAPKVEELKSLGVPNEDATNLLPLAYATKVVVRTNLRNLVDMSRQRLCNRAYWEYRKLMKEILWQLENYSDEWEELIYEAKVFKPKCEELGYCPEKRGCGRKGKKEE